MRIHGQMYLGVKPPFVRPISWLPPLAPQAWGWTLIWVASIMSHSRSGSSMIASSIFSQMRLSRQRQKRLWVFFQSPYSDGRSLHGAPVRNIQKTALTNSLLSRALPPQLPLLPMVWGSIIDHALSERSCRLIVCVIEESLCFIYLTTFYWRQHLGLET